MSYGSDRSFTDKVHQTVALREVYNPLHWKEKEVDQAELEYVDIHHGIDYIFENSNDYTISVQERFREERYHVYNDCTLRYRRDSNKDESRHESEFYKIEADCLVYGILNQSKKEIILNKSQDNLSFKKYVVVNISILKEKIKEGRIIIAKGENRSYINRDGKMVVPVKDNFDSSSSFVAFDVKQLQKLFGDEGIIIKQFGYY